MFSFLYCYFFSWVGGEGDEDLVPTVLIKIYSNNSRDCFDFVDFLQLAGA